MASNIQNKAFINKFRSFLFTCYLKIEHNICKFNINKHAI